MKIGVCNDEQMAVCFCPTRSADEVLMVAILSAFVNGGDIYVRPHGGPKTKYTCTPSPPELVKPEIAELIKWGD